MVNETAELHRLYDMLGTVAATQYAEQIQKVCCAFYEAGKSTIPEVPDFKTEREYEDFLKAVWGKYKTKLYRDGSRAGAQLQQRQIEVQFEYAMRDRASVNYSDVRIALEHSSWTVPK